MIKGKDLINGLPDDVKFRWHLGINEFGDLTYKEHLLEKEWPSLHELLMASFNWSETSEGVLYWYHLGMSAKPMMPHKLIKKCEFV